MQLNTMACKMKEFQRDKQSFTNTGILSIHFGYCCPCRAQPYFHAQGSTYLACGQPTVYMFVI